jgi:hypothetical protein
MNLSNFFTRLLVVLPLVVPFVGMQPALADEGHCQRGIGETRANTPAGAFELPRDGTVIHSTTNLQWAQCAIGQDWTRDGCSGNAEVFSWEDAQSAIGAFNRNGGVGGFSDWRLPTVEELETVVEHCREAPAINTTIFPDTPWAGFWTSSDGNDDPEYAWFVGFYRGLSFEYSRSASYRVRPVRSR